MKLTARRLLPLSALFALLLPLSAHAATAQFRVLFDVDNASSTGCTVGGMAGVDQVLDTAITFTTTSGSVTSVTRRVCVNGALGDPIVVNAATWPVGMQGASGNLTVETAVPISAFGASYPFDMRLGFAGSLGSATAELLTDPNGSPILWPESQHDRGRRRAAAGGTAPLMHTIVLDGETGDWGMISPEAVSASNGNTAVRLTKVYAYANEELFSFRFDAKLSGDAPVAADDTYTVRQGKTLTVAAPGVLSNDSDPNGGTLTASTVTPPVHGNLALNPNGGFIYINDGVVVPADTFEYKASNGSADSNVAKVTINVTPNASPRAFPDSYNVAHRGSVTIPAPGVLVNDTDADHDPLRAQLTAQPQNGTVILNLDGSFTYTHNGSNTLTDSFSYRASDGIGSSTSTTVTITIAANIAPVAVADAYSLSEGATLNVPAPGVMTNDTDSDTPVQFRNAVLVTGTANGTLTLNPNGSFTYIHNGSETTADSFTYRVSDGIANSNTVTVTLTITPVNDVPVAVADAYTTNEDTTLTVPVNGVLGNDSDGEGSALTVAVVTTTANGTLTLNANGSFGYVPNANFNGTDSFTYTATDGSATSAPATVTITVTSVNDAPVNTVAPVTTLEDTPVSLGAPTVADVDAGSGSLSVTLTATNGLLSGAGSPAATLNLTGTVASLNTQLAAIQYVPNANYNGAATVTMVTNDNGNSGSGGALSDTDVISITVTAVNDAPSFVKGADVTVLENAGPQTVNPWATALSAGPGETQNLSFLVLNVATPALFSVQPSISPAGVLTFTPAPGAGGTTTVTVAIHDDGGTANGGSDTSASQTFTINVHRTPVITSGNTAAFQAGTPQNVSITANGFPVPALSVTGTLPSGITFTDHGNGTATLGGNAAQGSGGVYNVTINATNAAGTTPQSFTITVCNIITVTSPATTSGPAGVPFTATFTQTGAVGTATFALASGVLPAGMTLASNGVLSGTPTQNGAFPITVSVTDANGCSGVGTTYNLTITCPTITVTNPANANGTASSAFSETFTQSGGLGTITYTLASGTLPTGLTLASNGVLSGTPTQTGSFPITVTATDGNGCSGTSATYTLVIACQTITVTNPANASGTAGSAFSETFTQSGAIGTATFTLGSGTLPAGLTLASNGVLSGTPTQTGSFPITVTATDGNGCTGTSSTYTIVIACQVITVNSPANGNGTISAPFSETFTTTSGIGTSTFSLASGTLPAGLTLAANGVLSGTPTQTGSFPITVTGTDSNGCTGTSATYTIVIGCQTITVTNPANASGIAGTVFSETFTQSGAVGSATFTLASGTLPAGLTLATNGVLSGTPTQTGSFPITVTVTDSNGCTGTSATYTIVIACQTITVTNPANSTGPAGSPFSETFTQSGAIGSSTFTLASGVLPSGLTLAANGVLSGTPSQGGSFPITVTVTDANGCTGTSSTYTLIITCPVITVTNPVNASGTAGSAFSETFTQSGAIGGATFTLASGTLPAGLTLASNGVLSGTPTQTGSFPITVLVTDGNGCTGTSSTYTLIIGCQTITVTNPVSTTATANSAFSGTFTQSGAIGSTTFTLASGTLPAGLTLAANGVLSGTPTQTGSFPITVTATDANGCSGTSATYTLVVGCQTITVTNPATTTGAVSAPFSQTFTQSGSIGSSTFTTASTLPAGLTLSSAGVLSGTPTQSGSFPIAVTVTDANGCTGTGATYTLVIGCQTITVTNPATTTGTVGSAFSQTFTQSGAFGSATFTTASTLPAGLTLAANGVLSGTPTQSGSFPIVVTVTDANGCTGTSATYTLVVACQTITVGNPANATGPANTPFSETFTQTSAIGTATFTTASTLPTGLTLATNGVLSGTPTQSGSFPIVVTVTDSNGCTGTGATYNLTITQPVATVAPSASYTEDAPATVLSSGATVTGANNGNITGATVAITGNFASAEDVLSATASGNVTVSYSNVTGVLTLSGTDTQAVYETVLRTVTYLNSSQNPSALARSVTWSVNDGFNVGTANSSITVINLNDAPAITAGATLNYNENDPATQIDNTVTITDADSTDLTSATVAITANYANGQDVLSFTTNGTITGSFTAATGTLTLSGTDTVANYQSVLRTVKYVNTSENPSTAARTISWTTNDGTAASNTATSTVNVNAVNDAPVVAAAGTSSYTEDSAPVVASSTITVSDVDSNIASATVAITTNFVSGEDILAFATIGTISGSYNSTTGVLTLTGAGTPAEYQAALRTVTYSNPSQSPSTATRTLTWNVNDGALSSAGTTSTLTVINVNDAPILTAGATLAYTENDPATPIDTTITVSDVDSANLTGATVSISAGFQSGADVLAVATQNGISGSYNAGTGVLSLTGASSVANYQTALRSVTYRNTSENPTATRTISWVATDGITPSATVTSTINLTAVNDAPALTAGATLNYTENQPASVIDNTVTVVDIDSTNLTGATVQITGNYQNGQDVLSFATIGAISGSFDAASGTLTLTGTDTVANYQAALRTVKYNNTSENPITTARTVTWTASDGVMNSNQPTSTITVIAVNDAPVLTAGGTLGYTEGDAATAIDTTITATDVDSANLTGATVSITANFQNGADVLSFATIGAISGSYNAGTGVLTLTGTDTVANYQAALRTVKFNNTSDTPTTAARTITFVATDGTNPSAAVTSTVNVTAVNDAPVNTKPVSVTVDEDVDHTFSGTISVADVDAAGNTIDVTVSAVNGTITLNGLVGLTVQAGANGSSSVTVRGTIAALNTALSGAKYRGNLNYFGSDTITITTDDRGFTGTPGAQQDVDTIPVTVNPVNDAPIATAKTHATHSAIGLTISAASHTGELKEGATDVDDAFGELTVQLVAGTISPANMTVTLINAADGSFYVEPPGGFTGTATFQFKVCDDNAGDPNQCSAAVTATINVTGVDTWFVDDTDAAGCGVNCNGSRTKPLVGLNNANANFTGRGTGDRIFIFSGTYNHGFTMAASERLVGQGASNITAGLGLNLGVYTNGTLDSMPSSGAAPTLQNTITAANNTLLRGVSITSGANKGYVSASGNTTLTVLESSVTSTGNMAIDVTGATNAATSVAFTTTTSNGGTRGISLDGVNGTWSLGNGTLSNNTAAGFYLQNANSSTITYSGNIAPTGTGRAVLIGTADGNSGANASNGMEAGTNVTLSGNLTAGGVAVYESSGGTLNLSGTTHTFSTGTVNAVELIDNDGATFNFSSGSLVLTTSSGKAFTATQGGTVNVTGSNNTISVTAGGGTTRGLEIAGASLARMAGTQTWKSINQTGGDRGISVSFFDGPVTVAGTGSAGTGGTIQSITTRGVEFINVLNGVSNAVSLTNMNFVSASTTDLGDTTSPTYTTGTCGTIASGGSNTGCSAALHFDTVNGVTLSGINVSGTTSQIGINGYTLTNLSMTNVDVGSVGDESNEDAINLQDIGGTITLSNVNSHNNRNRNFSIVQKTKTATMTATSSKFNNSTNEQGLIMEVVAAAASLTATYTSCEFRNNLSYGLNGTVAIAGGNLTVNVATSTLTGNTAAGGMLLQAGGGNLNYSITGNTIHSNNISIAITSSTSGNIGATSSTISGNTLGQNGVLDSCSASGSTCINLQSINASTLKATVTNNVLFGVGTYGIRHASSNTAKSDITITGNSVTQYDAGSVAGIVVETGFPSGSTTCTRLTLGGAGALKNNVGTPAGGVSIWLDDTASGTFHLAGYPGGSVASYVEANNTIGVGSGFYNGTFTNGSCP